MFVPSQTAPKQPQFPRVPIRVVNTEELALLLRCSRRTIERLVRRGTLRPMHIGRCWRFDYAEVAETLTAAQVR